MSDGATFLERAIRGDRFAFSRLLDQHYDGIYRMAYGYLRDREGAQDVAQVVCVKLATSLRTFDQRSSFGTWLRRIVINAAKDEYHRRQSAPREALDDVVLNIAQPLPNERSRDLWEGVGRLPERQRDCILLVYLQGLTHEEAGKILEIEESTVSWYVHEAKKQLRHIRRTEEENGGKSLASA